MFERCGVFFLDRGCLRGVGYFFFEIADVFASIYFTRMAR